MMTDNEIQANSPISYTVEEGEISSGEASPATIVETHTMDTGVQTTSQPQSTESSRPQSPESSPPKNLVMHIDNPANKPVKHTSLSEKKKGNAAKVKRAINQNVQFNPSNKTVANLAYPSNQVHATPLCQSTPVIQPTMQHLYYTNPYNNNNLYTHPPMPVFPPPIVYNPHLPESMPEPPSEINGTTPVHNRLVKPVNPIVEHYNQVQRGEISNTRPDNLRFPHAVTPRTNNPKSFFHLSTYEQSPSTHISETVWFKNDDPRFYANPDNEQYNPLLSFLNWANIPYENKLHNFHIHPIFKQQNRLPEFIPPEPCENLETIKNSTRNMGRAALYQQKFPQLKQFYSLTEKFLYNYNYRFFLRRNPSLDHAIAKASPDVHEYKIYIHEIFQLSFNFLHTIPKYVQCNNYNVHNLIYYTYLKNNNLPHENFIYINDQLTSPYFLKYAYTIKPQYMKGTLRNFDPVKKFYTYQPLEKPERLLIIPIEALEPAENYHSFHIESSILVKPVKKFTEFLGSRCPTVHEQEVRKAVKKTTIPHITPNLLYNALACVLGQNEDFLKELTEFKYLKYYPQHTNIVFNTHYSHFLFYIHPNVSKNCFKSQRQSLN